MRAEAAAISASEPDRRLPVPPTGGELARLAVTLNEMLGRLQETLERERRFVDDASHELRTPLGVLKTELDIAMSRSRSIEELEAVLRRASADTDRLARLAEDLLVLSRSGGGRPPVHGRRAEQVARGLRCLPRAAEAAGVGPRGRRASVVRLDASACVGHRQPPDNVVHASPANGVVRVVAGADRGRATMEDRGRVPEEPRPR
jgi:signal transduction histidine kinase